jgi:hypothetical protein
LLYPFRLQQVPALVPPHNLQACADCEAQQRDEGIPESNAIDVVGARAACRQSILSNPDYGQDSLTAVACQRQTVRELVVI